MTGMMCDARWRRWLGTVCIVVLCSGAWSARADDSAARAAHGKRVRKHAASDDSGSHETTVAQADSTNATNASKSGGRSRSSAAEQWLFVPVLATQLPANLSVSQLTAAFEAELRNEGVDVLASTDAARMFETRHSSEPVRLDSDEMTRLLRSVGQAARHLALGDLPQAQQAMEGVYALSGPARDYLNREAARAHKIFDTCLMTAYLWERDHQSAQALRQMLECSRSFPGFRPEGRAYPPELREVFDQAKQQLNQMPATTLFVTSKQGNSCGVRLNGIEMGKSPISFSDVRAGITRVQLECEPGVTGRVHSLELKAGENKLSVDPAFDAAVHSNGALWLGYTSESDRSHRADTDVEAMRQVVGATRSVQLLVDGSNYPRVRLRVLDGAPREVASLSYSAGEGYSHEAVVAAVKALRGAHSQPSAALAAADTGPIELDARAADSGGDTEAEVNAPAKSADKDEEDTLVVDEQSLAPGIVLAVAGVGGLTASWVLYSIRQSTRVTAYPDPAGIPTSEIASYNRSEAWILGVGGLGSLLFALSDYFWLPNDEGVPALAWVAGGVGAVIAFTGFGFSIWGQHCKRMSYGQDYARVCEGFTADRPFGPLLAMHGLPLLSIPISYALRAAFRAPGVQLSVRFGTLPAYGNANGLLIEGVF